MEEGVFALARPPDRGRPTGSLVFADLYPAANEAAVPGAVKNANPIQRARMYVYTVPRPRAPRTLLEPGFLGSDGDELNLDSGSPIAAMGLKNAPRPGSCTNNAPVGGRPGPPPPSLPRLSAVAARLSTLVTDLRCVGRPRGRSVGAPRTRARAQTRRPLIPVVVTLERGGKRQNRTGQSRFVKIPSVFLGIRAPSRWTPCGGGALADVTRPGVCPASLCQKSQCACDVTVSR